MVDLDEPKEPETPADPGSIAVVGSGNLGLIYFTGHDHRLSLEELEELHPGLVQALAEHPGNSFVQVRSARGGVAIGPRGVMYLEDGHAEGEDPTAEFGPHIVDNLRRQDAMEHAPDLLLLSQYEPELGEVAAYEELIGSHGGYGGMQTRPFILHPKDWELDEPVPYGAPAIYRNIRRWLSDIGIELGRPGAAPAPVAAGPSEPSAPIVADATG